MRPRDPGEARKATVAVPEAPWRMFVPPSEDLTWVAHRVACHARWPSVQGDGPEPPVTYFPTGKEGGWLFVARGQAITPAEALDLLDRWLPSVGAGFREWVWDLTLNGAR